MSVPGGSALAVNPVMVATLGPPLIAEVASWKPLSSLSDKELITEFSSIMKLTKLKEYIESTTAKAMQKAAATNPLSNLSLPNKCCTTSIQAGMLLASDKKFAAAVKTFNQSDSLVQRATQAWVSTALWSPKTKIDDTLGLWRRKPKEDTVFTELRNRIREARAPQRLMVYQAECFLRHMQRTKSRTTQGSPASGDRSSDEQQENRTPRWRGLTPTDLGDVSKSNYQTQYSGPQWGKMPFTEENLSLGISLITTLRLLGEAPDAPPGRDDLSTMAETLKEAWASAAKVDNPESADGLSFIADALSKSIKVDAARLTSSLFEFTQGVKVKELPETPDTFLAELQSKLCARNQQRINDFTTAASSYDESTKKDVGSMLRDVLRSLGQGGNWEDTQDNNEKMGTLI